MVNQSLLFIILIVIIVVLMFYLFKVETFQIDNDYDIIRTKIMKDLETEELVKINEALQDLDSQQLQIFFGDLKQYFQDSSVATPLSNFIELEKQCIKNQELLAKYSNSD